MICIDASVVVAALLPEGLSDKATTLFGKWQTEGERLVAPPILLAEVPSILRRAVYTGRSTQAEGLEALGSFLDLPVEVHDFQPLQEAAWAWGAALNTPRLYDMYYLALADQLDCDLWV